MAGEAVALDRPTVRAAGGDHPGVLARAVVVDRLVRPAFLQAAVELVLAPAGRGEQPAHRLHVARRAVVRGGGDRELLSVELRVGARERERLQGLRRRAQRCDEERVAHGDDALALADCNRMHLVDALDELAASHGYPERLSHGGGSLVPHPAMHAGFWPAITRRQSPPLSLTRLPASSADKCDLWLGAREPEPRRHRWTGH